MLQAGIIRPSISSFLRRRDGTWHFCVDYKALYNITIKDRFPIPTIDVLLDEHHASKFFTVLDLLSGYPQSECERKTSIKQHFELKRVIMSHFYVICFFKRPSNLPSNNEPAT